MVMRIRTVRLTNLAILLAGSFALAIPGYADEPKSAPPYLDVAIGHVDAIDNEVDEPGVFKLEYRFRPIAKWWNLVPAIGAARSEAGASFIFTDFKKDFFLTGDWVLTASFGVGIFDDGVDVKLGNELEFRSGIKISYLFENDIRVGLALFHLSNGGLGDVNPGTEPAFVSVSIPF